MQTTTIAIDRVDERETSTAETQEAWVSQRADQLYGEQLRELWVKNDRRFFWLLLFQWLGGIVIALLVSPLAWQGQISTPHIHLWSAGLLGAVIVSVPMAFAWFLPGRTATRHIVAIGQMLFGALLIHLTGGRIETHFHVFGSLAFIAFYRDWKVLLTATLIVVIDHGWRAFFWPESVFGVSFGGISRVLEHGGWVVFEDFFLIISIQHGLREMKRLAADTSRVERLNVLISASKQEADTIMSTVNQGLFLLNPDGRIGSHHSKALEQILMTQNLAGQDFLQLLRRLTPEGTLSTVRDYLQLMFDPKKREKQVAKLNPLSELEVTVSSASGDLVSKHLEFRFNRVTTEGQISHLLVAVSDATDRVRLEQKLKETEERKERQLDLLMGVLHVEPSMLKEFIESTQRSLDAANSALKEENFVEGQASPASFRKKLDFVFRHIHAIKGNAAALQLGYFEQKAHAIEDTIADLRRRPSLVGEDFLPIVLIQSELYSDLDEIESLVEKLVGMHKTFASGHGNGSSGDYLIRSVASLIESLSLKHGKQVTFVCEVEAGKVPAKYREVFKDVLVQLARNSLTHGIEEPEERQRQRKPRAGRIHLAEPVQSNEDSFEFTFRDDGRGLHPQTLQSRAVEMGLGTHDEVSRWDGSQLAALIFETGFSTANETTADAGRGVGMDVVKSRVVDEFGGEIRINSVPGEFCEFHIILPN